MAEDAQTRGHGGAATQPSDASPRVSASSPISAPKRQRVLPPPKVGTLFEEAARSSGYKLIAGLDEVGRGALAGPVVAAAVILDPERPLPAGLNDSKKLTRLQRERISEELKASAVCYAVGLVPAEEIDRTNILVATRRAMLLALRKLCPTAEYLLIDALQLREVALPQRAIIGGDACCASVAAASVIAKTHRDALMRAYDAEFPHYGFARHVGYGTREHWAALRAHGACAIHRRTFRGVIVEETECEAGAEIVEDQTAESSQD
ncbi:MAG: ribonuclease HII [Acidobacteria bacterium]|nr:ribonuclease HII [Acidobacteriota bacterium]